tara:strand:- start:16777 stop:17580 length:804 start_codon:yes stop_codon:yes gene_type:complete
MIDVGIIGIGIVGSAILHGFKKLGHNVCFHDIQYKTTIEDVLDTKVCFICVPTPSDKEGRCDVSIVEEVISELSQREYKGIVAIKSTVEPGATQRLSDKFEDLNICFVPEFLRERCAISDFIDNHDLCVIGTECPKTYNFIKEIHGTYPEEFVRLTATEAEFVKYFNNIYNATLITFANNFYEVCESLDVNYTNVKNAIVKRKHIVNSYLDCNKNFRGFGGACLPKDTKAIAHLVKEKQLPSTFFEMLLEQNSRYVTTVFDGMRKGD